MGNTAVEGTTEGGLEKGYTPGACVRLFGMPRSFYRIIN